MRDAFQKDRAAEEHEEQILAELFELERGLADPERRASSLAQLRERLRSLSRKSQAAEDSAGRRMARRLLRGAAAGAFERVKDPEYRKLLEEYRPAGRTDG